MLLTLGFVFGMLGSCVVEIRQGRISKSAVEKLLAIGVRNEASAMGDMMPALQECSRSSVNPNPERLRIPLSYTDHASLFYLAEPRELALLDYDQLRRVDWYLRALNECKAKRTDLLSLLSGGGSGRIAKACKAYFYSLEKLGRFSRDLLTSIDAEATEEN